ncbi:MAG: PepSY1/2 domain-containing protein, partial [bacterium]
MKETGMGAKRWMIFSVAFLLLLGGLWLRERREREMWQNLAEAEEREAFSALAEGTDALALALGRTALASGERTRAMAAAETLGAAARAKSALAALNCQGDAAMDFVSRCEDYALWLLRGGEADAAGLKQLSASAEALSGAVTELQAGALSGELTREGLAGGFAECLAAWDAALPALQYDGALSAGESAAPASLAEREEITPEEALSAAARFTGLAESVFTVTGERESALPVYLLTAGGRWNTLTLEVTKRGGEVLYYGSTRLPAEEKLTLPEAEEAARAFLRARGFAEL